jgi:hypothetical protein
MIIPGISRRLLCSGPGVEPDGYARCPGQPDGLGATRPAAPDERGSAARTECDHLGVAPVPDCSPVPGPVGGVRLGCASVRASNLGHLVNDIRADRKVLASSIAKLTTHAPKVPMTVDERGEDLPSLVDPSHLKPYASLMVVQSTGPDHSLTMQALCNYMARASRKTRVGNSSQIVASGIGNIGPYLRIAADSNRDLDDIWAFIYRRDLVPGWSVIGAGYSDTEYELGVVIRRNNLIAIHCNASLRATIQTWLDKLRPSLERVSPEILNGAFLKGEAKGLWLRGAHTPTTSKPDSKVVSGRRLQDSLNPFEDGGFALTAARASIEASADLRVFSGTVGTTPNRSVIWNKPTGSFGEFVTLVAEVLSLIEDTATIGGAVEQPYPMLAVELTDLSAVSDAFDIIVARVDDVPASADIDQDRLDAVAVLEDASFTVHGISGSANFVLDVGYEGAFAGSLRCAVVEDRNVFKFEFGYEPTRTPTNPEVARYILDALEYSTDLLSVYYDSGHMLDGHSIWHRQVRSAPFPNWNFSDFSGYDITLEKPCKGGSDLIHSMIGMDGDISLFAWVVARYSSGWLICDDGPGEVADFVHLAPNGDLRLIHVKAADSKDSSRRPAVGAYEVVASQATKNLGYLDLDTLHTRLASSSVKNPASWTDGTRVPDRTEFLELLQCCGAREKKFVEIVQPHISEPMYLKSQTRGRAPANADEYRMMLLETLLNSTRGPITGLGAELVVIGSLF